LNGKAENLEESVYCAPYPIQIAFPNFPRLGALKLGPYTCKSLSVPELVDSAPNLDVLDMRGIKGLFAPRNDMNSFWRGSDKGSVSNPQHLKLRIFCTDIPFYGSSALEVISTKFPNLVELQLGRFRNFGFDPFLSILNSNLPELQRSSWAFSEETFRLDVCFVI
jgi:hypothetical protein